MESITNCSRTDHGCDLCVQLATQEFSDELLGAGIDGDTTSNYADDSKLTALVNEVDGVEALPCDDRRDRARIIGRKAGEALVDRSKGPGDA